MNNESLKNSILNTLRKIENMSEQEFEAKLQEHMHSGFSNLLYELRYFKVGEIEASSWVHESWLEVSQRAGYLSSVSTFEEINSLESAHDQIEIEKVFLNSVRLTASILPSNFQQEYLSGIAMISDYFTASANAEYSIKEAEEIEWAA